MDLVLATTWSPSLSLYSGWVVIVIAFCTSACVVASLRQIRISKLGQLLVILGAPILFIAVLLSECGMFVLTDGKEFGLPIWARAYPNASDFLATYIALGASYLIAPRPRGCRVGLFGSLVGRNAWVSVCLPRWSCSL